MKTVSGGAAFWLFGCASLALALSALPVSAQSSDPIKIGVIGEESSVAGASLTRAAVMAAADINAHGGVNGRKIEVITYDDHSSAADAVRAFQQLHAAYALGVHWGTFELTDETMDDPPAHLQRALDAAHIATSRFRVTEVGQGWDIPPMRADVAHAPR